MTEAETKALREEIAKDVQKADAKTLRIIYSILEIQNEEDW